MSRTRVHIRLDPNRCDRCGACVRACNKGAIKVGPTYLYLDWRACDECFACTQVCPSNAITRIDRSRDQAAPLAARRGKTIARTSTDTPAGWRTVDALAVLAVFVAALFAKDAVLASRWASTLDGTGMLLLVTATLGATYAVMLGFLGLLAHRYHGGFVSAFSLRSGSGRWRAAFVSTGLVVALTIATRAAGWTYQVVVRALGWEMPQVADVRLTETFGSGVTGLGISILLVVVLAPLVEELVFRRVVLDALTSRTGPQIALVGQAVIFALYHMTPWLWGPTFIVGIACGWLAQRRATLWPAIALHAAYNAVLVAAVYYVGG
ncbi:MAG: CPBP family glutamic-type intramembrane protease [Coriobacteriia bacterium]|nr:CPBP family glutamic-type intramembrane protease [Coriobacteriia bacterium]